MNRKDCKRCELCEFLSSYITSTKKGIMREKPFCRTKFMPTNKYDTCDEFKPKEKK